VLPGRYVVPAEGGYGRNVAGLSPGRRRQLAAVARQLSGVRLARCEGHADGSATPRDARRIALRRAAAVCRWLGEHGVDADLVVRGFGRSRPRATNSTRAGRELNRRVEVIVVR
jgi:outer membrane protein OmpA-like peptidoglycan-associated protein